MLGTKYDYAKAHGQAQRTAQKKLPEFTRVKVIAGLAAIHEVIGE